MMEARGITVRTRDRPDGLRDRQNRSAVDSSGNSASRVVNGVGGVEGWMEIVGVYP